MNENKTWTLTLDKYQRDNLLWLIGLIGWWESKLGPGVEPFTFANTGDWLGEIGCMLNPEEGHGQPNFSAQQMIERVNSWLQSKTIKAADPNSKLPERNCAACGSPNAYRLNVNGTLYDCCEGSPACEEKIKALLKCEHGCFLTDICFNCESQKVSEEFNRFNILRSISDEEWEQLNPAKTKRQVEAAILRGQADRLETASWPGKNIGATKYEADQLRKQADELENSCPDCLEDNEDPHVDMCPRTAEKKEAPWWEKAFTGFTARKDPLPNFTVGEEVDLLNPPLWAPGSSRVIITNMKLHEDGRIQCSWINKKGGCGGAPSDSFRKVNSMPEIKACPCLHTSPCHLRCTCIDSGSSVGCRRCCTYGSPEQQKSKAEFLIKLFDKSRLDLANEVLKAQEARKDEDVDAWAERLANDAIAISEADYNLYYDYEHKEVGQFTCRTCGRDHSGISCEMQDECGMPRFPKRAALAAERRDKIVAVQQMVGKFIDEHPHMKNDFGDLERLIWEAKGGYPAKSFVCTCGSGGHPRHCKEHPDAYDKHVAEINISNAIIELEGFGDGGCCPICLEHGLHGDVWDHELSGNVECPVGKIVVNFNKMIGAK